jgi:hypothetical protein
MAGLWGCYRHVWQRPPPKLKTSMLAPWGVLAAGPAAATTGVGDVDSGTPGSCYRHVQQRPPPKFDVGDVDGRPPRGCWWQGRQRPPPKLKTSMAGPLGLLAAGPTAAATKVGDVEGGPPRGSYRYLCQRPQLVPIRDP